MKHPIFDNLFVLELANNHLGDVRRGLRIISEHAKVVEANGVCATIKLQLRDVDHFVHPAWKHRKDIRYVEKVMRTRLRRSEVGQLAKAIRDSGLLLSATAFDEASVDFAENLRCDILKIASSDIDDWPLVERVASKRKPTIVSTGGSDLAAVDKIAHHFGDRGVPLAINHCVSIYPSQDCELDLNQVDLLRDRYKNNVVGFSTHECTDWRNSMLIAYAKGARTFERHIDIWSRDRRASDRDPPVEGVTFSHGGDRPTSGYTPLEVFTDAGYRHQQMSPYCSTPAQIDEWFKAWRKAVEMCGGPSDRRRVPPDKERQYLDSLRRGAWAARDLLGGHVLREEDFQLMIPLQAGQLSCCDQLVGLTLQKPVFKGDALMVKEVAKHYAFQASTQKTDAIMERGLEK